MLAAGLSLSLFAFWSLAGLALLALLYTRRKLLQTLLLAPVVGVAATVLPIFLLSRAGLPVARFGVSLAAALLLLSLGLLWRLRPVIPLRQYMPFAAILLLAFFLTGWPMFTLGFDWISYGNDDMTNYVLAAHRLLNHGFADVPSLDDLLLGRDYTLPYWFMDVVNGHRPGSQLLLAWTASITGLTGHQIFMPVILAMHLVLISTTGALVCQSRRYRLGARLTCLLLSLSAMTSLGALYQLAAQVGGLGLLAGCATLLLRPFADVRRQLALRHGLLIGLLIAALLLLYPEVLPFLGASFVIYSLIGVVRKRLLWRPIVVILATTAGMVVALLTRHSIISLLFLFLQVRGGLHPTKPEDMKFPYFMIPSGLSDLWGFQQMPTLFSEPLQSIVVLLGGLLLLAAFSASAALTWRGQPAATVAFVMFAVAIHLFVARADFPLYKLAMYIQPFMLATLVTTWLGLVRPPAWRIGPLILLALAGVYTQFSYVAHSADVRPDPSELGAVFVEIPNASRSRLAMESRALVASTAGEHIIFDTHNVSLAKIQALYTRGRSATFPTRDFFGYIGRPPGLIVGVLGAATRASSELISESLRQRFIDAAFNMSVAGEATSTNGFFINTVGERSASSHHCEALIIATGPQSNFNRRRFRRDEGRNFVAKPCGDVRNHLIFISSELGQPYYSSFTRSVGIWQPERDILVSGQSMSGVGRHLLFQAINPSESVRFSLDLTATLKADGENRLPAADAIGTSRRLFGTVGRGSARVFSPPITPQTIHDRSYVAIDMTVEGQRFPEHRTGLMALYGNDVPFDRRRLVGFARDISLISNEEYARLSPPSYVDAFPAGLTNPNLEYSGVYEDGWVSEAAFFQLTQPENAPIVAVRGVVPLINDPSFTSEVRLLVGGQEVARQVLSPGDFDIRAAAVPRPGRRRVELHFSNVQRLPGEDRRLAAARLRFIGFEGSASPGSQSQRATDIMTHDSGMSLGAGWYPFETHGGQTFRWVNNNAEIVLGATRAARRQLHMEIEPGPGVGSRPFELQVRDEAGRTVATVRVKGRQRVTVDLPARPGDISVFRLHVEGTGRPAPNDPRILSFRIFKLGWRER